MTGIDYRENERRFYAWQKLARACLYCGKPQGNPWSLQIYGTCPLTSIKLALVLRADTLLELREQMLSNEDVVRVLSDPLVIKATGENP